MIVLIIAGGSGTRLWPLSTPGNPKHLLNINNDNSSLLQQTYERAKLLTDSIYIITEIKQVDGIIQQLPDLSVDNIIIEPAPRGTANCFISALNRLKNIDSTETIAFMHADNYIRDLAGFVNTFTLAKQVASQSNKIVLLGTEPDYPSTGLGYIEKGELLKGQSMTYKVRSFKEKPNFNTAKSYIKTGNYLWNCGYFVGKIGVFLESIKKNAPDLYKSYQLLDQTKIEKYNDTYLSLPSRAIDYALIEKIPDLLVIPASFDWMDLGTFNDLSTAIGGDELGNSLHGTIEIEDVRNSLIQNHEEKPMAVIGLDNVIVINTKEGILVLRKDLSQRVGDVSKALTKL